MPKALIPNHMFFDNDDEPYTVLRTIRVGLEMQGFTVVEDPECMFTHGAHGNQEAQAATTCAELDKAGKLLTPHELELLALYRSFTPSEREDMLRESRLRQDMAVPHAALNKIVLTDNTFTPDLSGMNLSVSVSAKVEDSLRTSTLEALNNVTGELLCKGWTHHSFGAKGELRFCKSVNGELQYAEVISRVIRDGDTLTAIVESRRIDPPSE
ncbi:hypothetical protein OGW16_00320 [Citrobacter sp. Ce104]|uniref:hypothetical protein n=1 Tax=Citrobacter sp. Ce104 TaxID=2985040 RepID=UPI00257645B9|nr:hypothetical protein [Citrobacter sp. Ce104]MDM3277847.1 hypothetical protein [Citrobacter sp. Ce104]